MKTMNTWPDLGILLLRLGLSYSNLFRIISSLYIILASAVLGPQIILAILFGIASLMILLGFFSRGASIFIVLYYLIMPLIGLYGYQGGSSSIIQTFFSYALGMLPTLLPYLALFFLGSGKYSIDGMIARRRSQPVAEMI